MQEMQQDPKMQEIQKKYKGDREKLQQEQLKLYQEKGFNPLAPCLPTLIQFPIMIGLYQAIMRSLSSTPAQLLDFTRHIYRFIDPAEIIPINSHFLWMNLNQPERVFIFGIGIPVLAILVVVTTYLQSRMMTPPGQPGDQSSQMTQSMNLMMPLMMGWFAYQYSSGLAVYFVIGNLIGITQYAALGKLNWRNLLPGKRGISDGMVIEPKKARKS
jgi:YidC/Oxa1 family membrane protein insertase